MAEPSAGFPLEFVPTGPKTCSLPHLDLDLDLDLVLWFINTATYFSVHGLTQANAPGACRLLQPGGQRYALFASSVARSQTRMGRTLRFSKKRARLTPGYGRNNSEAGKPRARLHADRFCAIRVHPCLSASQEIRHCIYGIGHLDYRCSSSV